MKAFLVLQLYLPLDTQIVRSLLSALHSGDGHKLKCTTEENNHLLIPVCEGRAIKYDLQFQRECQVSNEYIPGGCGYRLLQRI